MLLSGVIAEQELVSPRRAAMAVLEDSDTVICVAQLRIIGFLASTEGWDTVVATNFPIISASLDITDDDDALVAIGQPLPPIVGNFDRIESNDTLVATGLKLVAITGTLSVVETNDTISASGALQIHGTLSVVEGGDTLVSTGVVGGTPTSNAILREDGTYLLREIGDKIVHE